jgi:hypothetical protein
LVAIARKGCEKWKKAMEGRKGRKGRSVVGVGEQKAKEQENQFKPSPA